MAKGPKGLFVLTAIMFICTAVSAMAFYGDTGYRMPRMNGTYETPTVSFSSSAGVNQQAQSFDIILVSSDLADYEFLIAATRPGSHVYVYDAYRESAESIVSHIVTSALDAERRVDSISVLSHGRAGAFSLGKDWITPDYIEKTPEVWQALKAVLSDASHFYIYGCSVLESTRPGFRLINKMSEQTGAVVFASDDVTGKGGDWILEGRSDGGIDRIMDQKPLVFRNLERYQGTLAPPVISFDTMTVDMKEDGISTHEFTITDDTTTAANLFNNLWANSDNQLVIANKDIQILPLAGNVFRIQIEPFQDAVGNNITVTIYVKDDDAETSTAKIKINVLAENDAPVLKITPHTLTAINEDSTATNGNTIAEIVADNSITEPTDEHPVKESIAVTSVRPAENSAKGTWQYSTDDGAGWTSIDDSKLRDPQTGQYKYALLLDASHRIRFVPNAHYSGKASFDFRAWDQTSGTAGTYGDISQTGGTTAFSGGVAGIASIDVRPINDAPVLNTSLPVTFTQVNQNDTHSGGDTVKNLLQTVVSDKDDAPPVYEPRSIAVIGVGNENGSWQYTLNGVSWNAMDDGYLSQSHALLLKEQDRIRFVPATGFIGTAQLTFRVWDESDNRKAGTYVDTSENGGVTALSAEKGTALINVVDANGAPVLANADHFMTTIYKGSDVNLGDRVADVVTDGSITEMSSDEQPAKESIAVGFTDNQNGVWYYKKEGVGNAIPIGNVDWNNALLLKSTDVILFVPLQNYVGEAVFRFRAWDESMFNPYTKIDTVANKGGTGTFSDNTGTAKISVVSIPSINLDPDNSSGAAPGFSAVYTEGDSPVGIADADASIVVDSSYMSLLEIEIVNYQAGDMLTATTTYTNITAEWLANRSILRLHGDDSIQNYTNVLRSVQYSSTSDNPGNVNKVISLPAGVSGVTATVRVNAVNDPPVISLPGPVNIDEDATLIFSSENFNAISVGDPDAGVNDQLKLELEVKHGTVSTPTGQSSKTYAGSGTIAQLNNTVLNRVMYTPPANYVGQDTLTIKINDNGASGTGGELTDTKSLTITIINKQDAPVLSSGSEMAMNPINRNTADHAGESVTALISRAGSGVYNDPDPGAMEGIAVVGANNSHGTWEYSLDSGSTWLPFNNVSPTDAVILDGNARIRFVPETDWSGKSSLTIRAWDGTDSHVSGDTQVDTTTNGGTTAFSQNTAILSISVSPTAVQTDSLIADAGPDQNVGEGQQVMLDGSNSIDLTYGIYSYNWTQIEPQAPQMSLSDPKAVQPTFTSPAVVGANGQSFVFMLTVTNNAGHRYEDTCIVNVTYDNAPPVADAGPDQTVAEGQEVTLDAFNSADSDGSIVNYTWKQVKIGDVTVSLSDPNRERLSFTAPQLISGPVALTFLLTVKDSGGLQATDTCVVNVISQGTMAPVAHAGGGQVVKEGTTVVLDASQSSDPGQGIEKYLWSQIAGKPVTLIDITKKQATFVAPPVDAAGATLKFKLTVENYDGLKSSDEAEIVIQENGISDVNAPSNVVTFTSSTNKNMGIVVSEGGNLGSLNPIDPATIGDVTNRPENLIYGVLDMAIKVHKWNTTAKVTVYLPEPAPANFKWYKYSQSKGWYDYSDFAEFNADRTQVTLTLIDGGTGDDDGVKNGIIIDPSTLGESKTTGPNTSGSGDTSGGAGAGDGGGGCFIQATHGLEKGSLWNKFKHLFGTLLDG